jgi:6-phosphogluconolactonase
MKGHVSTGSWARPFLAIATALSVLAGAASPALAAADAPGAVYIMTNASAGNAVQVFDRAADGTLAAAGMFATGGAGNGGSLHSQGALTLSEDGRFLFGVNAGSNEVFSFATRPGGLQLKSHVASGGTLPTSVSAHGKLVYVLNNGSSSISGFQVDNKGRLHALPGSTRALSTNAADPAEIAFDQSGRFLAVTERATNLIDIYAVAQDTGLASGPTTYPATGAVPYGFAFNQRDQLIVSEAGATAVSSYGLSHAGVVTPISGPLSSGGAAPCWIVVTQDGKYAYVANAGAGNIKGFSVARNGALSPLGGATAAGTTPVEMTMSGNSRFLYVLEAGSNAIGAFSVRTDGSLSTLSPASGLPASAAGLAAR